MMFPFSTPQPLSLQIEAGLGLHPLFLLRALHTIYISQLILFI